jgi:hypothetical protein
MQPEASSQAAFADGLDAVIPQLDALARPVSEELFPAPTLPAPSKAMVSRRNVCPLLRSLHYSLASMSTRVICISPIC